ncbi:hypothetical protein HDV02_003628 [Globomyces sp. JEL0801]|nr:hypothetical protein HDV02_003628 [Globomyces sp. JEL0801]
MDNVVVGDTNTVRFKHDTPIFNIPFECILLILQFLDPISIRNIAISCKSLSSIALVVLDQAHQRFKHFTEFDCFVHRGDRYWQDKVENGITFCHLASVCWLEIQVSFTNLYTGYYQPTFQIRRNKTIKFCALIYSEIISNNHVAEVKNVTIDWRHGDHVWYDFYIEPIEVKHQNQIVRIRMRDNGGNWIYGVDLRLIRVE